MGRISAGILALLLFAAPVAQAFSFKGEIDFQSRQAILTVQAQGREALTLRMQENPGQAYSLQAEVVSLKTPFFDISTVVDGTLAIMPVADKKFLALVGKLQTRDTLLDRKPSPELSGQFEIRQGVFFLRSLNVGDIKLSGEAQLSQPYKVNLSLEFQKQDLSQILAAGTEAGLGLQNVDGSVAVSGTAGKLFFKGKWVAYQPSESGEEYQCALINFSGPLSEITIADSNVIQPDGMIFNLFGKLNFYDYKNLGQQIEALAKAPLVNEYGNQREWTFKKLESADRGGSTELKYLLRSGREDDPANRGSSDLLGVERKIEF